MGALKLGLIPIKAKKRIVPMIIKPGVGLGQCKSKTYLENASIRPTNNNIYELHFMVKHQVRTLQQGIKKALLGQQ